jgi:hypothetical protein
MVSNLTRNQSCRKTIISTSGNWKIQHPVIEKAIIVQMVTDMTKLHLNHLWETAYAESINDIISGLRRHQMP